MTPPLLHGGAVWTTRFGPDGRRLLTASADGTAQQWDATTGTRIEPALVHPPGCGVTAAVFSPDGSRIATVGTDFQVRLWDTASGRLRAVLSGHTHTVVSAVFSADGALHGSQVESAAFSPEGARVVTSAGSIVQIWDVATGRPLEAPMVHPAAVDNAMFSPDGSSLLTVAEDGVRIWSAGLDTRTLDEWRRIADSARSGAR
jgi:WD40 repeat protein